MTSAWRRATTDDAPALRDLERRANLAALGHIFDPDRYPYPDDAVLARWAIVLADPSVVVEVAETADHELVALVAYDDASLRHLAVDASRWGTGLGEAAVERAVSALARSGARHMVLWCLAENTRALALYHRVGWTETGRTQQAEWPPYPTEVELSLRLPRGA